MKSRYGSMGKGGKPLYFIVGVRVGVIRMVLPTGKGPCGSGDK